MSTPAREQSISQLSARVDEVLVGLKWASASLVLLLSIPNICAAQAIVSFQEIFQDALPGRPFPILTMVVLTHRTLLQGLTFVWPILGLLNVYYGRRPRSWIIGAAVILLVIGLQLLLTQRALLPPISSLLTGMPDTDAR
jgi:glucose uptake protein GlcU